MTVALTIGDRQISSEELVKLLAGYRMLPELLREILVDDAIAHWEKTLKDPVLTDEELTAAQNQYLAQNQITSEEAFQQWLKANCLTEQQFLALAVRGARLEKFKIATWGPKIESYFLSRKSNLDKVIYSLIRTKDVGIAQELYFRVEDDKKSFAELARTYSQGPESQTDGLIGPVELSVPHPTLAQMLSVSQPGQLWPPTRIGEWMVILRLERFIPAQMDDAMRQRLLNELFSVWLEEQVAAATAAVAGDETATIEPPPDPNDATSLEVTPSPPPSSDTTDSTQSSDTTDSTQSSDSSGSTQSSDSSDSSDSSPVEAPSAVPDA